MLMCAHTVVYVMRVCTRARALTSLYMCYVPNVHTYISVCCFALIDPCFTGVSNSIFFWTTEENDDTEKDKCLCRGNGRMFERSHTVFHTGVCVRPPPKGFYCCLLEAWTFCCTPETLPFKILTKLNSCKLRYIFLLV